MYNSTSFVFVLFLFTTIVMAKGLEWPEANVNHADPPGPTALHPLQRMQCKHLMTAL